MLVVLSCGESPSVFCPLTTTVILIGHRKRIVKTYCLLYDEDFYVEVKNNSTTHMETVVSY